MKEKIRKKVLVSKRMVEDKETDNGLLVILNDDYNTFQKVIVSMVQICGIDINLAYTYTLRVHNNGECIILKDKKNILNPMCETLNDVGLTAEVRDDKEDDK